MFQCSSASRKFLKRRICCAIPQRRCFSALQRAENSSIPSLRQRRRPPSAFQCSSASRKFLNGMRTSGITSVLLFQCSSASRKFLNQTCDCLDVAAHCGFSALQRAENSSNLDLYCVVRAKTGFSALQRAENSSMVIVLGCNRRNPNGFSALQRAENSSIRDRHCPINVLRLFQCSSASRKFLNIEVSPLVSSKQRVSVLFSEPKIPQRIAVAEYARPGGVSVLFSEPKIPQSASRVGRVDARGRFSALQRAENSSTSRRSE